MLCTRARLCAAACLFALLTLAQPVPAQAKQPARQIVDGWVELSGQNGPVTTSYGPVSHNSKTGETTISDFEMRIHLSGLKSAGAALEFDFVIGYSKLILVNLTAGDGSYRAKSANFSNVKFEFVLKAQGKTVATIRGAIGAQTVTNFRWTRLPVTGPDPDRPVSRYYPLLAALVDYDYDHAVFSGVKLVGYYSGDTYISEKTFQKIVSGKTVRGDTVSYTDFEMREIWVPLSSGPLQRDISYHTAKTDQFNLGSFVRSLAPGKAGPGQAFKTFVKGFLAEGLKISLPGGTVKIASMKLRSWAFKPARIDLLAAFDKIYLDFERAGKVPDQDPLVDMLSAIAGIMRLAVFQIDDLRYVSLDMTVLSVKNLAIRGLSSDGMNGFEMSSMDIEPSAGAGFYLGSMKAENIRFAPLRAIIDVSLNEGAGSYAQILKAIPTIEKIVFRDLIKRQPGKGNTYWRLTKINMGGFVGQIPARMELIVDGYKAPVKALKPPVRKALAELAYSTLKVSYAVKMNWQEDSNILSLIMTARMANIAAFNLSVTLGRVARPPFFENPLAAASSLSYATLNSARLKIDDKSIVARTVRYFARKQKIEDDAVRQQTFAMITGLLRRFNRPGFTKQVIAAVKRRFAVRGAINISASPGKAVSMLQIFAGYSADPGSLVDLLGIAVSAD